MSLSSSVSSGAGHVADALVMSGQMAWQITWSLILGFTIAAAIEAVVHKDTIAALLPDSGPASLAKASGLGAASSSCSYAAVAMARSLVRKGANFGAAMAFEIASTNLVVELGLILALLIGWQFTLAEFVGGPIMIAVVALVFGRLVSRRSIDRARRQADQALSGSMEGHAAMDMSVRAPGSLLRRLLSRSGLNALSDNFVMEWAAILRDLVIGLLIAGAAAAWIPNAFWQHLFVSDHPLVAKLVDPLLAPLVAMATCVCSIGNVPLAAVLWNGGISFGGVVSFIFADLLILPLIVINRRYYGSHMSGLIVVTFYAAAVVAGYLVEVVFGVLHLVPLGDRHADTGTDAIRLNYTSVLDALFVVVATVLVWSFFARGQGPMLAMMGGSPDGGHEGHDRADHQHRDHV